MSPLLAIVSCKVLFFLQLFFRVTFLFSQLLSKHSLSRDPLGVVDFPRPRPSWPEICLDRKSPIISPDIENGRGSLERECLDNSWLKRKVTRKKQLQKKKDFAGNHG